MRQRLAFAAALLLAALPSAARTLRLKWMHSMRPAAGLTVAFDDGSPVRTSASATSDRAGSVVVPAAAKALTVADPMSGLRLVSAPLPAGSTLLVPEPIRVRAGIIGAQGAVRVRAGFGARGPAVTRFQRDTGALVEERPARSALRAALPLTPMHWTDGVADGQTFLTGWISADGPPQLVASDAEGDLAFREVAVPAGIVPRTTIDAGSLTLLPPHRLAVSVKLPAGDIVASLQLHVTAGTMNDDAQTAAALAALDQYDRQLFALLALGDPYVLPASGAAVLNLPPWLTSVTVVLRDSFGDGRLTRQLPLVADDTTTLDATLADLGITTAARDVTGVVKLHGTEQTAPGATVVLNDAGVRRETRTDDAGRFRFDGVQAKAPLALFVDAGEQAPASHRRMHAFQATPHSDMLLELPEVDPPIPQRLTIAPGSRFAPCDVGDEQYPYAVVNSDPPNAAYEYQTDADYTQIALQSNVTGTFLVQLYVTPFVLGTATVTITQPNTWTTAPLNYSAGTPVTLTFWTDKLFQLANGTEVSFSPPGEAAHWLDATETDVGNNSQLKLPCVNINTLDIFIDDDHGRGCQGELLLSGPSCTIFLPVDPTQPCKCTS